jgi:penicillin-binding protein 2
LDEGVITPQYGIGCNGTYYGCRRPINCTEKWAGHATNLRMAIAHSCNSYFSQIYRLAVDNRKFKNVDDGYAKWKEYMNSFGLGVKLGVDIPSEDKGLIVDTTYYNKLYNSSWNSCTNVFLGIGQGEMQATPLQMANMMCIIANKGYYYTPHFVEKIDGQGEGDTVLNSFKVKHNVTHIPDTIYNLVQLGMQDVIEAGTGRVARIEGISIAGKTGTAENYGIINGKREKLEDHSWFVCFAPRDNPKIAVAVIIENAGFGATWAGPIARMVIEKYLNDSLTEKSKIDSARIAEKEIILPIVKAKRMRLDSLRRVRLAREMGDSSHTDLPEAPALPKLKKSVETPGKKDSVPPKPKPDTSRAIAQLIRQDDEEES